MKWLFRCAVFSISLAGTVSICNAQNANQQTPQSGYTLQAHVREVVVDITVTDRNSNPIHGLSESAFHLFDNSKPQHVVTFEEHTQTEPAGVLQASAGNAYSNDVVLHPPRTWNLILIDTHLMGFVDQAYLNLQLEQFIKQLPPDEPFALLARRNHLTMYANFTTDHQRLLNAVHAVIPYVVPSADGYESSNKVVDGLCDYLQQFPGRKNVFWFEAVNGLTLRPDPTSFLNYQDMRGIYDELESSRIALYPVDVRGLLPPAGDLVSQKALSMLDIVDMEHLDMEDEADATGGRAVINQNDIAGAVKHLADDDASFYTLTYSPQEVKVDNRWHAIKVQVDGGDYQISYRHGYFDDGSNLAHADGPERKHLLQDGSTSPQVHMTPIALQVRVTPSEQAANLSPQVVIQPTAPAKKGERSFNLHYSVPMDVFPQHVVGRENQLLLGVGVFAFDQHGRFVSRFVNTITLSVAQKRLEDAPADAHIGFDQQINLPSGENYLYVAVWNPATGRFGTVQIPFEVKK